MLLHLVSRFRYRRNTCLLSFGLSFVRISDNLTHWFRFYSVVPMMGSSRHRSRRKGAEMKLHWHLRSAKHKNFYFIDSVMLWEGIQVSSSGLWRPRWTMLMPKPAHCRSNIVDSLFSQSEPSEEDGSIFVAHDQYPLYYSLLWDCFVDSKHLRPARPRARAVDKHTHLESRI